MKIILTILMLTCGLIVTKAQTKSPIDGNWLLVEKNGEKIEAGKQQFKMFNEGYYAMVAYNNDGTFKSTWMGKFSVQGNKYTETFIIGGNPKWIGWKGEQEWYIKGDTLYMMGHKRIFDPAGKEQPASTWGSFIDKRVRAKD